MARVGVPLCFAIFLVSGCAEPEPVGPTPADIVLTGGTVMTATGSAEAIAIRGERIVAVDTTDVVDDYIGDETEVVDLTGRVVLPGFHDMHVHPIFGGVMYSGADYTNCRIAQGSDLESLLAALDICVARAQPGDWITGGQWDVAALGVTPDRSMLDAVAADVPVILNDTSGHSVWVNSRGLELAGITGEMPDPPGGIIERDADGEPTGLLRETANGLARMHVPPPSHQVIRESLLWSWREMLSYGITSYVEASGGFVAGAAREASLYLELADEGLQKHRVRICTNYDSDQFEAEGDRERTILFNREAYRRERLTFDCAKLFLDGVPTDSHTAAMLDPYDDTVPGRDDRASRFGLLLIPTDELNALVTALDAEGLRVKFHAAGDAAVRAGLNAIATANTANGGVHEPHTVGHVTFIAPEDLVLAREIGATLELSPYLWAPSPINDDITKAVGLWRIERVWPFREVIDAGVAVVPGSDWSVVPSVNPWSAIESLVTRELPGGSELNFGAPQAITVDEAIHLFTVASAEQMGGDATGVLAAGHLADLIVIDRNPYEISSTELHEVVVDLTMIGGEVAFRRDDESPAR